MPGDRGRPDGPPVAGQEIIVVQRRHGFRFGGTDFDLVDLANGELDGEPRAVVERSAELFWTCSAPRPCRSTGAVTSPSAAARHRAHPAAARWLVERGVTVKGHPLVWHTVTAAWLLDLPVEEVDRRQLGGSGATSPASPAHRHLGRDQRGRDHAGVRRGENGDHPDGAASRAGRDRPGGVRAARAANPAPPWCSTTSTCPRTTSA